MDSSQDDKFGILPWMNSRVFWLVPIDFDLHLALSFCFQMGLVLSFLLPFLLTKLWSLDIMNLALGVACCFGVYCDLTFCFAFTHRSDTVFWTDGTMLTWVSLGEEWGYIRRFVCISSGLWTLCLTNTYAFVRNKKMKLELKNRNYLKPMYCY